MKGKCMNSLKKTLGILLIVLFTLTSFGCSSKGNKTISLGETVESNDIALTFNALQIPEGISEEGDSYVWRAGDTYQERKNNHHYRMVFFTVDNIGKSNLGFIPVEVSVKFDNDYNFSPQEMWYFDPECLTSDLKEKGVWLNSMPQLGVFDEPIKCCAAFLLPDEALNSDKSLIYTFTIQGEESIDYIAR